LPPTRPFARLFAPFVCGVALLAAAAPGADGGGDAAGQAAARAAALQTYKSQVQPFMTAYCARCHSGNRQKGGVTFQSAFKDPGSASFGTLWKRAAAQVKTHSMPPEDADEQPTEQERKAVVDWVEAMKRLSPKDPGPFVIRRLSRAEYGNTLHDLFGVDPQVAQGLPDEVFGAGYTNSLSPLLMEQYLAVANEVLDRVVAPPGAPPTAVQRRLFGPDPAPGADRRAAAREVARSVARLAYRRPPTDAEVDVLLRVFALASDQGSRTPRPCG
jgi:mono/diheme cytochrome c family protein